MVPSNTRLGKGVTIDPKRSTQSTPSGSTSKRRGRVVNTVNGIPFLRNVLEKEGFDKITIDRILQFTWRPGTVKLYTTYIKKWGLYCLLKSVPPLKPSIPQVARFLRMLEDEGLGYGAVNTARCALSVILPRVDSQSVGKHHYIHWVLKAVYARNPPKAKYNRFWDVGLVFDCLKQWPNNAHLSLRDLSLKVTILMLLTSGHRGQTIAALSLKNAHISRDEIVFELDKLLKSNRVGDRLSTVTFIDFSQDKNLCIVRALREYISRTAKLRSSEQLLISFIKPHGPISRDTLARWTVRMLKRAGVDTGQYSSHSTRGAMVSKARLLGVSVHRILKHAGWKTHKAFAKHYDRRVVKRDKIASTILQS